MNDLSLLAGYRICVNSLGNLAILYCAYIRFRYATTRVYSCVVCDKDDYYGMITWFDLLLCPKGFFVLFYSVFGRDPLLVLQSVTTLIVKVNSTNTTFMTWLTELFDWKQVTFPCLAVNIKL